MTYVSEMCRWVIQNYTVANRNDVRWRQKKGRWRGNVYYINTKKRKPVDAKTADGETWLCPFAYAESSCNDKRGKGIIAYTITPECISLIQQRQQ